MAIVSGVGIGNGKPIPNPKEYLPAYAKFHPAKL
jgi:hypothetical protein